MAAKHKAADDEGLQQGAHLSPQVLWSSTLVWRQAIDGCRAPSHQWYFKKITEDGMMHDHV